MPGKVSAQRRFERFVFVLHREWEILRRSPDYIADIQKGKNSKNVPQFLRKFRTKYHISPIDPQLSFTQIHDRWLVGVKKGYDHAFPLETLYRKNEKDFPIFRIKGTQNSLVIVVNTQPSFYSLSDTLDALDAILDNAEIKGSKAKLLEKPFMYPPDTSANEIRLLINRNATKSAIKLAILKMLKKKNFPSKQRQNAKDVFRRQMGVYDYIKAHPKMKFIEVARNLSQFYANKKPSEREKICHADYTDACSMIGFDPRKGQKIGDEHPKHITLERWKQDAMEMKLVSYDDELEAYLEKVRLGISIPKRSPKTWDRNKCYERYPCKIFDDKHYSQEDLTNIIKSTK